MATLQRHVFVCVNERPAGNPKGCCHSKGGQAVRDALKKALALRKLKGIVRANNAGCLDHCERGVVVVVYPEQVWYQGVTVDDVEELVTEHVMEGRFVERLMMPGQERGASSAPALRLPVVEESP